MTKSIAKTIVAILVAFSLFQFALILGAPLGHFAWGGQHEVLPVSYRFGSAVAIALYVLFAVIAIDRSGVRKIFHNPRFSYVGAWIVVAYLGLGIVLNAASRSEPERYTMTPLVLVLFALFFIIARSKK